MGPSQDGRVASPGSSQERSSSALGMAGSLLKITHYTSKGENRLVSVVNRIMKSRHSLLFCVGVLARMTSIVDQSNRATIAEDVSLERLKMTEVTEHVGRLTTLDPFLKDGVWVITAHNKNCNAFSTTLTRSRPQATSKPIEKLTSITSMACRGDGELASNAKIPALEARGKENAVRYQFLSFLSPSKNRKQFSKLHRHAQVTHDTSTIRRLPLLPWMILYVILKVSPSEDGVV